MNLSKRLLKSGGGQSVVAWFATLYIRLVHATTRWRFVRPPAVEAMQEANTPFIVCFWHARLILMPAAWRRKEPFHMLISGHRDGILISRAIGNLGYNTVAGSSKRGGLSALRAIQRILSEGHCVGITPDGPRGPRMRVKPGAIKAAQLSGVPILPLTGATSRRRILSRSWDHFCLALPFARGAILWGEPLSIPRDASAEELERLRRLLEDRLNALTAEADRLFGQEPTEPATPTTGEAAATESPSRQASTKDRSHHARA